MSETETARQTAERIGRWVSRLKQAPSRGGLPGVAVPNADGSWPETMDFVDWVEMLINKVRHP